MRTRKRVPYIAKHERAALMAQTGGKCRACGGTHELRFVSLLPNICDAPTIIYYQPGTPTNNQIQCLCQHCLAALKPQPRPKTNEPTLAEQVSTGDERPHPSLRWYKLKAVAQDEAEYGKALLRWLASIGEGIIEGALSFFRQVGKILEVLAYLLTNLPVVVGGLVMFATGKLWRAERYLSAILLFIIGLGAFLALIWWWPF